MVERRRRGQGTFADKRKPLTDHVIEVGGPDTLPQLDQRGFICVLTGFSGSIPTVALLIRQVRLQEVQPPETDRDDPAFCMAMA
jgi:hypothetical protein